MHSDVLTEPGPRARVTDLPKRIAFLTVGQSPRDDLVPPILSHVEHAIEALEYGALDGLDRRAIAAMAPGPDDHSLVTRLADGSDVVVSKTRINERLHRICAELGAQDIDLIVFLSTGLLEPFYSLTMMISAQRAVDSVIDAHVMAGQRVGVVVPLECQVEEVILPTAPGALVQATHALHGDAGALKAAALRLGPCDLVVMHSLSYSEADRALVAEASGTPAVLARRVVAGAIRLLLDRGGASNAADADLARRVAQLTRRQREVMMLVVEGLSHKEIGRQLGISPRTVEIHRACVMEKMGVATLPALIRAVLRLEHCDL